MRRASKLSPSFRRMARSHTARNLPANQLGVPHQRRCRHSNFRHCGLDPQTSCQSQKAVWEARSVHPKRAIYTALSGWRAAYFVGQRGQLAVDRIQLLRDRRWSVHVHQFRVPVAQASQSPASGARSGQPDQDLLGWALTPVAAAVVDLSACHRYWRLRLWLAHVARTCSAQSRCNLLAPRRSQAMMSNPRRSNQGLMT